MSIASWKAEFYPTLAWEQTEATAVDHSIQKWEGLTADNLAKHGVECGQFGDLRDAAGDEFYVDAASCSLCAVYWTEDDGCEECPILCRDGRYGSPFYAFIDHGNPVPMLNLLKKVKAAAG